MMIAVKVLEEGQFGYPIPVYSQAEFLSNIVPKPFYGLGGKLIKPRIRVKMARTIV